MKNNKEVIVDKTNNFQKGQVILVLNDKAEWMANKILDIKNSKTILLESDIQFHGNLYLRSYQYSKVYPTHVSKKNEKWFILGTCFDQHKGIASSGIEFTCTAQGDTLDSLKWDKFTVPLFGIPSNKPNDWNSISIENASLIKIKRKSNDSSNK